MLLPGNKNIIPVAEQVDALTTKTVRVVPTRSMPEGLAALMAYDPEADAPANVLPMRQAAEAVVTGEVTKAVRSSKTPAGAVSEGDWLGIVRGDGIVAIGGDVATATKALLEHLVGESLRVDHVDHRCRRRRRRHRRARGLGRRAIPRTSSWRSTPAANRCTHISSGLSERDLAA